MRGNFTRVTFRPERHYSGVRLQQGRVQLDADFNEHVDIEAHRQRVMTRDILGAFGVPQEQDGFAIFPTVRLAAIDAAGSIAQAVGQSGTILASHDSGATWTSQTAAAAVSGDLHAIDMVDSDIAYVVGEDIAGAPLILKTTDGGTSWTGQAPPAGTTGAIRDVSFVDPQHGCAVGDAGLVLVTTNGGSSWTRRTVAAVTQGLYGVHFITATHAWAVGDNRVIVATTDGGATWQAQQSEPGSAYALRGVHFVGQATGWAVGDGATIFSTSNGGATWTRRPPPSGVTANLQAVDAEGGSTVWAVGDRGTVVRSGNGGLDWQATTSVGEELTGIRITGSEMRVCGELATIAHATAEPNPTWALATFAASERLRDLGIGAGRIYVDGILCESDQPLRYLAQPDLPDALMPTGPGRYLGYLDVWERHVTALERPELREVALGGPDTATRTQTVWQLRIEEVPDGTSCRSISRGWTPGILSNGMMRARGEPAIEGPAECLVPIDGGYQRLENQLYRVEVVDPGGASTAKFAWSRDNGTMLARLEQVDDLGGSKSRLTVSDPGRDRVVGFAGAKFVELSDERRVLQGAPIGRLFEVEAVTENAITIKHSPSSAASLAEFGTEATVRRWDGYETVRANGWIPLEGGVQVQFTAGQYAVGDYWTMAARTNTASVEWQSEQGEPRFEPRHGVEHSYCPLAVLDRDANGGWSVVDDCRAQFTPLTGQTRIAMAGGDGQELAVGSPEGLLPYPLEVAVSNGSRPVAGATVRFEIEEGAGSLAVAGQLPAMPPTTIDIVTDLRGIAACDWRLVESAPRHRVRARLLDRDDHPLDAPIHFNARVARVEGGGFEDGVHIESVLLVARNEELRNDSDVSPIDLFRGIDIACDRSLDPAAISRASCYVTVEIPFPSSDPDRNFWGPGVIGFVPVALDSVVIGKESLIQWRLAKTAIPGLETVLFVLDHNPQIGAEPRLLCRLVVHGHFITSEDQELYVDGDAFGRRDDGIVAMGLPSGDGRRGGDYRMWFWLSPGESELPLPLGGRLDALFLDTSTVVGGGRVSGRLVLEAPAEPPGMEIRLRSSDDHLAVVPPMVRIAPGRAEAEFPVETQPLPAGEASKVVISASAAGVARQRTLTLTGG